MPPPCCSPGPQGGGPTYRVKVQMAEKVLKYTIYRALAPLGPRDSAHTTRRWVLPDISVQKRQGERGGEILNHIPDGEPARRMAVPTTTAWRSVCARKTACLFSLKTTTPDNKSMSYQSRNILSYIFGQNHHMCMRFSYPP